VVERQISRLYNTLKKVVISDTLKPEDTTPWATSTEVIPRTAALDRTAGLKAGCGGDILCFGSLTTWNPLLAVGLVDELHVLIVPGVIGSGLPTFTQAVKRRLTLLGAERVEDTSLVALRYCVGGRA
jgi:dihydrofolate reductase